MKKGEKMSEEQKMKIVQSNKKSYKEYIENGGKPYHQAFGKDNPACRPEVRKQIKNTVKKLWDEDKYDTRVNGMKDKTGFLHHNYSPESELKFRFNNYLSKFQDITKCSLCGKTSKKINIHHVDENHKNWLVTNLEPLCIHCHQKFHFKHYKQPYVTIRKEFNMECCHQLHFYDGKCQRYHGHSYKLFVEIRKRINPETGMVMDFGKLKEIVNTYVIEELDHFDLNTKMPFQTTAENMIFWIWKQLEIKGHLKGLYKIKLYETATSCVTLNQKDILEYEKNLLYKDKN